jgi:hypothetical protein
VQLQAGVEGEVGCLPGSPGMALVVHLCGRIPGIAVDVRCRACMCRSVIVFEATVFRERRDS